jgi:hypothetical protein
VVAATVEDYVGLHGKCADGATEGNDAYNAGGNGFDGGWNGYGYLLAFAFEFDDARESRKQSRERQLERVFRPRFQKAILPRHASSRSHPAWAKNREEAGDRVLHEIEQRRRRALGYCLER